MQRENPLGGVAPACGRCFEELVDRGVELERHLLDVLAQLVPRREPVLARHHRLRIVQGYLRRSLKLFRLVFELIEVRTGGELLGHNNLHAERRRSASRPARRQPCRELDERVDSVLRADPHAPRARGNNGQRRARRQGCSLAAMTLPLARRIAVSFPALRHRDFTLLWIGQLLSFSGSRMQTAAILWHVSLLAAPGRKAIALGLVGAVQVVPIIVFSMLSGVVADALDRRKVMLATQTVMALLAAALAALTFAGLHTVWPIYVLAALSSAAASFDGPARQALIPNLVPREHLASPIGLHTLMFQFASVAGPTLAGLVIAGPGIAWVYAVNAVLFLMVIAALLLMRARPRASGGGGGAPAARITWAAAREGLRFVFAQPIVRSTMLLDFVATFFASATALLPIFAQDILHVGARGYGWLYAAPSVGAALAGLVMAYAIDRIERRGAILLWAVAAYGAATVVFGISRSFWLTLLCLAAVGAADTVSTVIRNIVRQLETPDELRGRMTGVNMIFFMGGPQLGELEAGVAAQLFGAVASVVSGGIGCLLATALVARREERLRRYRR